MKKYSIVFLILLLIIALSGCKDSNPTNIDTKELETEIQEPEAQQEVIAKPEKDENESRGIIGSHYQDARLGLEERGFPKKSLGSSELMKAKTYENIREDGNTGLQYGCSLFIEQDNTVISATFDILNLKPLETEEFIEVAKSYLKYCASIPYDSMDADKVKAWIDENISGVGSGDSGLSIIVGDAKFSLYGTEVPSGIAGARLLEIEKLRE